MKFFRGLLFIACVAFVGPLSAQDSKTVLDKLSTKVKSYSSFKAEFDMILKDDLAGDDGTTQSGSVIIKDEKFVLDLADYKIICDAQSWWTYYKEGNECTISDFEEMQEEAGMTPSEIFTIWENGYKHEHKGSVSKGGKSLTKINLYPTDGENEFHTITLLIDESNYTIKEATLKGRDGQTIIYKIKTFTPNVSVSDNTFLFKKENYPGVIIEDERD